MGTDRKQLSEKLIRTRFSGLFNHGMRRNICCLGKGYDRIGQPAYRDIFSCGIYRAALLYASKIKCYFKINFRGTLALNGKEESEQSVKNTALSMPIRHGNTKEARYKVRRKITTKP